MPSPAAKIKRREVRRNAIAREFPTREGRVAEMRRLVALHPELDLDLEFKGDLDTYLRFGSIEIIDEIDRFRNDGVPWVGVAPESDWLSSRRVTRRLPKVCRACHGILGPREGKVGPTGTTLCDPCLATEIEDLEEEMVLAELDFAEVERSFAEGLARSN
jgi:hypothetical protein